MVSEIPSGVDMMNQISLGELKYKQSNIALEVKEKVSTAMEEIITMGARVRPLKLNGKRVGWLRPLAYSERKVLDRMIEKDDERVLLTLTHCTTLSEEDINDLDMYEMNSILHRLYSANVADMSLFPYISAFCTTQISQNLWYSKHDALYSRRELIMPDGKILKLLALPDHIALWSTLTTIRNRSITKLEDSLNFGSLIKAQIGKDANKYIKELVKGLNEFQIDIIEPWTEVVDYVKLQSATPHFSDGFGHSHEDNTVQGLLREMEGMMHGDKHEQLMQQFYDKQLREAQEQEHLVQLRVQKRRQELALLEDDGALVVVTDAEVKRREREIHARSQGLIQQQINELSNQSEEPPPSSERITKYFEREG
jgi:hypothetical protein